MSAIEERLRVDGRACTGDVFEATAFFARDSNAVACLINEEVALAVGTVAVDMVFFGEIAENEKDHVADMLVTVEIVSFVCFTDSGKLCVVDQRVKLIVRKLDGFQNGALGADEQNIDSGVSARKGEKLSGHEKLAGNDVMMRCGAENAGNGQTEFFILVFLHNELGAAAGTFELDHIPRKRERTDNAENGGSAHGATIGDGCVLGL
jgi:hypothetical protein